MSADTRTAQTLRLGAERGWREFRGLLASGNELFSAVVMSLAFVLVVFFQRNETLEDTGISTATAALPGIVAMMLVYNGLVGTATYLTTEREDGTLLRAKALPGGIASYLWGKTVFMLLNTLLSVVLVLVAGLLLFDGVADGLADGGPQMLGMMVLGLAACLPIGAILGTCFENPRTAIGSLMIPFMGLTVISGVLMPVSWMPDWVQTLVQFTPLYWLGLGMRAAMLPDTMLALEIGGSWRVPETLGVLALWAVAGFALALVLLRRMTRTVNGATLDESRLKAMQRV
ncbi:ABC transporter permease [Streptomyces cacaoi]|uniref:ABC transporter permease n=1 Tax=Streptomyces cacaoi TaxID=1898 RepID=UPI002639081B|nr:ABC transporter permease [Streptomyces cacaoi]